MPVRIYEIAKNLGVQSKDVLAKAKDLKITNAKVASSSLDKITAEYLEQEIEKKLGLTKPAPEPEEAPAAEEPKAEEPTVKIIRKEEEEEELEYLKPMDENINCLLYTSPSPRDLSTSRMPSSA